MPRDTSVVCARCGDEFVGDRPCPVKPERRCYADARETTGESAATMKALLTRGNTAAVVAVAALDLLLNGAHPTYDPRLADARDALDAWARDARAAASEWKP